VKPFDYYDKPPSLSGMRHLGNHVMLQLRKRPRDAELTERLAAYAVPLGGCSVALARRLEATRLRWLQRYDEALERLQEPEPCRICEGDRLFRLATTALAKAFATDKLFDLPLEYARASQAAYQAIKRLPGRLEYVLRTAEASACQPLGQCLYLRGEITASIVVFRRAYDFLDLDREIVHGPGKGRFRSHWWGKSSRCCPSLPTYKSKIALKGDCFLNLAMAFCASPDPSDVKKAFEMMPRIKRDFPRSQDDLNGYRAQWLDGRLLVVKHGQTTGGQARQKLRSAAKTRLTFAYKGFLRHPNASPADAMAVLTDLLALPWLAGKTADEVDRYLNVRDPDVWPHLEAALEKLPTETQTAYKALKETAMVALRDDTYQPLVIKCLDTFRERLADLSWPPMAAWYRSHFAPTG